MPLLSRTRRNSCEIIARLGHVRRTLGAWAVHALPGSIACLLLLVQAGCALIDRTPHERYARSLRRAGLHETALGRDWLAVADSAVARPSPVALPMKQEIAVAEASAWARGFRLELRRGQRLRVRVAGPPPDSALVFADLFETTPGEDARARRVASATSSPPQLDHEVRRDGTLVLRLQCELLRAPRLSVVIETEPALAFPVEARDGRAVISSFGEPRAGGRRVHHGIDIAAPRGTPVLSATRGFVTSAGTNRLGGNVVWVMDPLRRLVLYYAHLDRHAVGTGERVVQGDTLGFVGNTGNAERTVPHLHFGIYAAGGGALDPHPFVVDRAAPNTRRTP
jgi:murein DD-endopeptidase MepM/ murein hydrolase activator NlpD